MLTSALLSKPCHKPRTKPFIKVHPPLLLVVQIHTKMNSWITSLSKDKNPAKLNTFGLRIMMTSWWKTSNVTERTLLLTVWKFTKTNNTKMGKRRENSTIVKKMRPKTFPRTLVKPYLLLFKNTKKSLRLWWKNTRLELQRNSSNTCKWRRRKSQQLPTWGHSGSTTLMRKLFEL